MFRRFFFALLLSAITSAIVFSPVDSFAQKKKPAKKAKSAVDEFDSIDGDDELEKELQQIESEEFGDLDSEKKTETPKPEESAQEEPAQAVEEAPAQGPPLEEPDLLSDEPIEEPGVEEPAPAPPPKKLPKQQKAEAKPLPPPEPPPPQIQEEPPEPVVEQEPEEPAAPPEPVVDTRPAPTPEDDSPDNALEERLQRIYQQFYANRMTDEEWTGLVGDRISETYQVSRGDTLWGISVTFFGNGFFWPKLWQLNSDGITNPHEINVGDKIVFSMGTLGREPEIKVAREADQEFIVKETEGTEAPQKVTVPGRKRYRPVLENIPPSLPAIEIEDSPYDEAGFAITAVKSPRIADPFPLTSLLTDSPPPVDGEIVEVETGGSTAAILQSIFVRLKRGGVGDILSAFIVRKSLGGGVIFGGGLPIEFQGEIEITEQVSGRLFKAVVISNFDQIEVGAKLTSGPIPEGEATPKGRANNAQAKILGGPMDDDRKLFGVHSIVYLEGGSQKGIETGDVLTILKNDALRTESELNVRPTNAIGKVKVLNVSRKFSTGVIVQSEEEIRPGDRTGTVAEE
jgi:nucleoid-associated protein YgaU